MRRVRDVLRLSTAGVGRLNEIARRVVLRRRLSG
jgi:hypothetical protein